jgi:hypothetical protein
LTEVFERDTILIEIRTHGNFSQNPLGKGGVSMKRFFVLLLGVVLVLSFSLIAGCQQAKEKPGEITEKAGEMKDEAVEKAGEMKDEAVEKAGEMKEKAAGYGAPKAPGYGEPKAPGYGEPKK